MGSAVQRRWTPSEILTLDECVAKDVHPELIAKELGRTIHSVKMRLQIDTRRRWRARQHRQGPPRVQIEPQYVAPPPYVLRERVIRYSIPQTSLTQMVFHDPVEGYSALAAKDHKLSVQDALEICALYTGRRGEIVELAKTYRVGATTISAILDGSFFERLLPSPISRRRKAKEI